MLSLVGYHHRMLDQVNAGMAASAAAFTTAIPPHIDDEEGVFRLLEIPDRMCADRRLWLRQFLTCHQHYIHTFHSLDFLAQAEEAFDVVLVSGDDLRRVSSIVRHIRATLPSKAIVPVLSDCSRTDSTYLLNRGADDILHCGMPPVEATARLHAIMRRLEWRTRTAAEQAETGALHQRRLRSLALARLSPSEEGLLTVLADHRGQLVPYSRIMSQIRRSGVQTAGRQSLAVIACHLRKKLVRGAEIVNHHGLGYALKTGGRHV